MVLSDLLPLLDHLGFVALDEQPFVFRAGTERVHLYDIGVRAPARSRGSTGTKLSIPTLDWCSVASRIWRFRTQIPARLQFITEDCGQRAWRSTLRGVTLPAREPCDPLPRLSVRRRT